MKIGIAGIYFKQIFKLYLLHALIVVFYLIQYILDWPLLKLSRIKGQFNFEDFITIFTSASCFRTIGLQIYNPNPAIPSCFYPYGRTFIYLIDLLRIPSAIAPAIIICTAFLIVILSINSLGLLSKAEKFTALLFLLSPPLWLALERGNADLLICLLVLISAFSAAKGKISMSICILTLATLIKFYTFPLLLIVLWSKRNVFNKFANISLIIFVAYVIYIDIQSQHLQQPGSFAFGTPVVTFWINAFVNILNLPFRDVSIREGQVMGLVLLGFITAFLLKWKSIPMGLFGDEKSSLRRTCLIYIGTVYVSCFVLGMSYDYRLVFSILSGLFFMCSSRDLGSVRWAVIYLWILSLWLSVFSFGLNPKMHLLLQWVGNLFDFITAGFLTAIFIELYGPAVLRRRKPW